MEWKNQKAERCVKYTENHACVLSGGFPAWHHYRFDICPFLQRISVFCCQFPSATQSVLLSVLQSNNKLPLNNMKMEPTVIKAFAISFFSHPLGKFTLNLINLLLSLRGIRMQQI